VNAMRARQKRNLLATLLLSVGTPMLLMGDELSRTQNGNNNAYAQDNETSWLDWSEGAARDESLFHFVRALVRLRKDYASFRRMSFLDGRMLPDTGLKDVYWLAPEGREMQPGDWTQDLRRTLGMQIGNEGHGERRFLIILNAAPEDVDFLLPEVFPAERFVHVFDTGLSDGLVRAEPSVIEPGGVFKVPARTFALLQHVSEAGS
jgi:isoamylase